LDQGHTLLNYGHDGCDCWLQDVAPLHHIVTAAAHPPVHLSGLGAWLHHQFAHNRTAQKVLLGLTLLMTAMVLGDGVLTPSISGQQCYVNCCTLGLLHASD
jgi:hypothetical protein